MSPHNKTGVLVQDDGAQPALPLLPDDDETEVKVEASAVKQLLGGSVVGDDGEELAAENDADQALYVGANGVEGAVGGAGEGDGYATREDGRALLVLYRRQLAELMPGGEEWPELPQIPAELKGNPGEEPTPVIAQLLHTGLPSPGGTRTAVFMLPDRGLGIATLDMEQFESLAEASMAQE